MFGVNGLENHLKDFVATFLSTNFSAKTRLPASGDSNVNCCAFLAILRRIHSGIFESSAKDVRTVG